MIRLLIVDDEQMTRDGLKQYIPWEELGVGAVETAKNGQTALELASVFKPDILLTDVRMPKMDGIQLASRIRKEYPNCKIIFLSGYSDKEYLKSAIHLKAISYIEKPLNIEEITATLKDAIAMHNEEEKQRMQAQKMESSLAESIPLLRQEIALELIKDHPNPMRFADKYDTLLLKSIEEQLYTAAAILLNWQPDVQVNEKNSIKHSILKLFCSDVPGDPMSYTAGFATDEEIVWITAGNLNWNGSSDHIVENVLAKLQELSKNCFTASIGVGSPVKGMGRVPASYREAGAAAKKQFYHGVSKVYYFHGFNASHLEVDQALYDEFKDLLKADNWEEASDVIKKFKKSVEAAEDDDINFVKNVYFNLLTFIIETAREHDLGDPAIENEKSYIWQQIESISTLSELSEYLQSHIDSISNRINEKEPVSRKAYEIMKYIRENYADKQLSIESIARHSYLSQTYLCYFFKKTTGKTLNEYITEVRIEKAKELLKTTNLKLYEIAANVGFADKNYFSTLFKKTVGITPSAYRERYYL